MSEAPVTAPTSTPSSGNSTASQSSAQNNSSQLGQSGQSGSRSSGSVPNSSVPTGTSGTTPSPGSPNAPQNQPQYIEKKINGKMVRMTQQEADDYLSMSYAATERFKEAAKIKKEIEAREAEYAKNPIKALLDAAEKAKLTPEQTRAAIEEYYAKQWIEPERLTPEQRELKALQEYKKQREAEIAEWQRIEQEKQNAEIDQKNTNHLIEEIGSTLENADLPKKNKFLFQRMAFYMLENNKHGYNAPKEVILRQVINEHKGIVGDFLKDASIDQVINYAGQEFVDKILKYSLEKLRENRSKREQPFVAGQDSGPRYPNGKIDMSEVNRRLRDMRTGKFTSSS